MKRRVFLKASAASALAAPALATEALGAAGAAPGNARADRFYYDERFADARALAARAFSVATSVDSDVTQVWTQDLNRLSQMRALSLEGVTTESFYFCLHTLLQSHATVTMRAERIGKDLYAWRISTALTGKTG